MSAPNIPSAGVREEQAKYLGEAIRLLHRAGWHEEAKTLANLAHADGVCIDDGKRVQQSTPCIMDFPTAWAYVREHHPDPNEHDPKCSWVQAKGGVLCDCHVLNMEYARRKAAWSAGVIGT